MITQLRLKYFQRHQDLTLDFEPGLTSIRAPNEGGKSTLIRGILYALYGSRALPASLSAIVTWGYHENDLRVELDLFIDGKVVTFTRAKSGAEVLIEGKVFVTGQTEVTNYATELIGADLNTANRLLVANQGNLRGALESGPKAAAEMVESLADFELFDTLLERASSRLTLGSDAQAKERLQEAEENLEKLTLEKPDLKPFEKIIETLPAEITQIEANLATNLRPKFEQASEALTKAKEARSAYDLLQNNLTKVKAMREGVETQRVEALKKAEPVDTSPIDDLKRQLTDGEGQLERYLVFQKFTKLVQKEPDAVWENTLESLQVEIQKTEDEAAKLKTQCQEYIYKIRTLAEEKQRLKGEIQKDDHCRSCGQLLQDHEEIAKRNKKLESRIEEIIKEDEEVESLNQKASSDLGEKLEYLQDLKGVVASTLPYDQFLRTYAQYVEADLNFVPPKLSWKGDEPLSDQVDTEALQKQIKAIEAADEQARNARARVKALEESIQEYESQVQELTQQLEGIKLEDVQAHQEAKDGTYADVATAEATIDGLNNEIRDAETQIKILTQAYEHQQKAIKQAEERIEICKEDIKTLGFNNALVKRLRELRPVVGNQLWNLILGAVSTMFTDIRGVQSVVTRDKDGFKVNGENIDTLSGSTLDMLGAAIRVALIKTFIPNCPFFILDEAFASSDSDRTKRGLAFISTLDFPQVLLITHEDISETVANSLITLEG